MRVQSGFVNVVATALVSLWCTGIIHSQESTTRRGVSPSSAQSGGNNNSRYGTGGIIRITDNSVNGENDGYNNTNNPTDTSPDKQRTSSVTTNTSHKVHTTTHAPILVNTSTKSTIVPSMIHNETAFSSTPVYHSVNQSNHKEQVVLENVPDGKSHADKDLPSIEEDLQKASYEAIPSSNIPIDTEYTSDDKEDTRSDTDDTHGDNADMHDANEDTREENQDSIAYVDKANTHDDNQYTLGDSVDTRDENQDIQGDKEDTRDENQDTRGENVETGGDSVEDGVVNNITTAATMNRDTNVTQASTVTTHAPPTLPHKHHVEHHKTKHVSGSHHAIPFRHHLQLVPMEDEPFGAVILKDERYVVSVMIPIGVGIIGAAIIIATLYTLRYIARKNARDMHFPPDIEHSRPHSSCISSISSERTDRVVLLGGDEDDDF